jgi:hypothetical protein
MSWKDKIVSKALSYVPDKVLWVESAMRKVRTQGKDINGEIEHEAHLPMVFNLEDWRLAIASATDPKTPNRKLLSDIHKSCELDDHLMTVWENRELKIKGSPFKTTDQNGEADEEAVKLLKKPWFLEWMGYALRPQLSGTKVVQMQHLDENLELAKIKAIPDSHINPKKKLILKNSADSEKGWNYDKGSLSKYYMQLGEDDELGVMSKLAVAVLFLKKARGNWLDYIEKYGVPPRWVITDREDDERFDELYDMMQEMIGNQFAVLRGQEKIEIMPPPSTDAHKVFKEFIELMQNGITKRIAGAIGTVDEKAFVGAAKVHQDTFNDRHWYDKFVIQYLVNDRLIPFLVNLSPAYAPLANLTFEWDETENLTLEQTIKHITELAKEFDLDPEEVKKMTGYPILKQKNNTGSNPPGNDPSASVKKKSSGIS